MFARFHIAKPPGLYLSHITMLDCDVFKIKALESPLCDFCILDLEVFGLLDFLFEFSDDSGSCESDASDFESSETDSASGSSKLSCA
jgi:hypothetical protein